MNEFITSNILSSTALIMIDGNKFIEIAREKSNNTILMKLIMCHVPFYLTLKQLNLPCTLLVIV